VSNRTVKVLVWTLSCILLCAVPAAAVFSGDEQFDRDDLNTERALDPEFFVASLAYRPFWRPAPAAARPQAFARTSEGSISGDEFLSDREIGVRGAIRRETFIEYRLNQHFSPEEDFLYQSFALQAEVVQGMALRVVGQPTGRKQNSDLGAGLLVGREGAGIRLDVTAVDLFFNAKNLVNEDDRRKHYNVRAVGERRTKEGGFEAILDFDTPLERDYRDENRIFSYDGVLAMLRGQHRSVSGELSFERDRLGTTSLADRGLLQHFQKEVWVGETAWHPHLGQHVGVLGLRLQRRDGDFDSREGQALVSQRRTEANPYVGAIWKFRDNLHLDTTVIHALTWWGGQRDPAADDFVLHARLKTALRLGLSEHVTLLLNPTWDLDKALTGEFGHTFDGGNIQLAVRLL
jgi:hypothetical protein